mgnify:CR=1 FL=1
MPTGSAFAPWGVPGGFAWFGGFPENEVERGAFLVVDFNARARTFEHVFAGATNKLTVFLRCGRVEIDALAFDDIGRIVIEEFLDGGDHAVDEVGGSRVDIGGEHIEAGHLAVVQIGVFDGYFGFGAAFASGALDDVVVDVGDVGRKGDVVSGVGEESPDVVEHHTQASMA